jgi:hypothetical protein
MFADDKGSPHPQEGFTPDELSRLTVILNRALDEALGEHIGKLFTIMVQDPVDQPARAIRGARTAIKAWHDAIRAVERAIEEMEI